MATNDREDFLDDLLLHPGWELVLKSMRTEAFRLRYLLLRETPNSAFFVAAATEYALHVKAYNTLLADLYRGTNTPLPEIEGLG